MNLALGSNEGTVMRPMMDCARPCQLSAGPTVDLLLGPTEETVLDERRRAATSHTPEIGP